MAIKQEKNPTVELSKEEKKALASLDSANADVIAQAKEREKEAKACEQTMLDLHKNIEAAKQEVADPAERRRLRMGK